MADSYPKLPRNTVNRYGRPRGKYDYETIHTIVNSVPVLHVSFNTADEEDPFPATLPMLGFMGSFSDASAALSEPLDLYIHGYISSRLMKLGSHNNNSSNSEEDAGLPVTVAATHLDGLVLALTPNHHSYNYRSAILHGHATAVTDADEKLWAMEQITNNVVADRWANSRVPPTETEMKSTQILRVAIVDASAKVREGGPGDDRHDLKNEELRQKVWIGVVPTWTAYGEPVAGAENRVAKVPEHISGYIKKENENGKETAFLAARK